VNTKLFSAFNENSKRKVAWGITIVDSIDEPIKVLKILLEGLTPAAGAGIWITRFHGLPVARSYSPFDLVYLDNEYRVVHHVEITKSSNFVPFKGLPTCALVLPPSTIASSKIFTGDHIVIRADESAAPQSEPAHVTPLATPIANAPAESAPASAAQRVNIIAGRRQPASSLASTLQQEVLRPAKQPQSPPPSSHPSVSATSLQNSTTQKPAVEPEESTLRPEKGGPTRIFVADRPLPLVVEPETQPASVPAAVNLPPTARVTTIPDIAAPAPSTINRELTAAVSPDTIVAAPVPPAPPVRGPVPVAPTPIAPVSEVPGPIAPSLTPEEPQPLAAIESDDKPPRASVEAPTVPLFKTAETQSVLPANADSGRFNEPSFEALVLEEGIPAAYASDTHEPEEKIETQEIYNQRAREALNLARRWDVKLLYSLFPELHPAYRPELEVPSIDLRNYLKPEDDGKLSTKVKLLSWLYPELELHTVEKRQREQRRAPRVASPGLIGYFYSSGRSEAHEITNFSIMGFYMKTDERWLPGTVIRVTLQVAGSDGSNPEDTLSLHARVVNFDAYGGGFEFVLPGFLE